MEGVEERPEWEKKGNKYSIIIPTYNERVNIALITYLIFKHLRSYGRLHHVDQFAELGSVVELVSATSSS